MTPLAWCLGVYVLGAVFFAGFVTCGWVYNIERAQEHHPVAWLVVAAILWPVVLTWTLWSAK